MWEEYDLMPTGRGRALLRPLHLSPGGLVMVGRNEETFSLDNDAAGDTAADDSDNREDRASLDRYRGLISCVSRQHVRVKCSHDHCLSLTVLTPNKQTVAVNGTLCVREEGEVEVPIEVGDVICLLKASNLFHFRLVGVKKSRSAINSSENTNTCGSVVAVATPTSDNSSGRVESERSCEGDVEVESKCSSKRSDAEDHPNEADNKHSCDRSGENPQSDGVSSPVHALSTMTECAICLEPIACAHSLLPCGHTFCFECLSNWLTSDSNRSCPSCQCTATGATPSHLIDGMVEEIVRARQHGEGLKELQSRQETGRTLMKSKPLHQNFSAAKKRKRQQSAGNTGRTTIDLTRNVQPTSNYSVNRFDRPQPHPGQSRDLFPRPDVPIFCRVGYMPSHPAVPTTCTRCRHCRGKIPPGSLFITSVGPPFFNARLHVYCLGSYNRGVAFLSNNQTDSTRRVRMIDIVNVGDVRAVDKEVLRMNVAAD